MATRARDGAAPLSGTLRVWSGRAFRKPGRCKFCRRSITWITDDQKKERPFTAGAMARETLVLDDGRRFDLMAYDDLHHCDERKNALRKRPRLF